MFQRIHYFYEEVCEGFLECSVKHLQLDRVVFSSNQTGAFHVQIAFHADDIIA